MVKKVLLALCTHIYIRSFTWVDSCTADMREIKYRAFVLGKMRPVERIEFYDYGTPRFFVSDDEFSDEGLEFTGLKDKSGKEIYEGDVVHFLDYDTDINHKNKKGYNDEDEGLAQVLFGHTTGNSKMGISYTLGWFMEIIENPKYKPFGYYRGLEMVSLEIIGNIHENPELIT